MLFTSILVWKKGLSEDQFVLLLTPLTWLYGSIVDMSSCLRILKLIYFESDCYPKSFILSLPFVAIKLQNTSLKIDHERDGITKASFAAPAIAFGKMTRERSIFLFFDY